ncbi:hypothetical protein CMI37_35560 [Candidatus Pacearchaeota archaeon]|nr:hypothetical protein [Candidatus Pacearchaeota archaeon]|tara:strand:- start:8443 stop:9153 length:711 start_codon:yes stop_codon:yes gene_type:complete
MSLVPAGKTRLMVAQTLANPLSQGFSDPNEIGAEEMPSFDEGGLEGDAQLQPEDDFLKPEDDFLHSDEEEQVQPQESNTLSDYIFNKLQSYGYPGRRLEEFKKKFVKESVSPDGNKDITVEIPDRHYPDETGQQQTIETSDLSGIVKEVEAKFGLHFNGAERSEGKWTIKLTSSEVRNPEGEEGMVRDNLDEVYGTPSNKGKPKKNRPVQAFTIHEMIKGQKEDTVEKLKKITGDK